MRLRIAVTVVLLLTVCLAIPHAAFGQDNPTKELERNAIFIVQDRDNKITFLEYVLAGYGANYQLSQWDLATDQVSKIADIDFPRYSGIVDNDAGKFAFIAPTYRTISIFDLTEKNQAPVVIQTDANIRCAALSENGEVLAALLQSMVVTVYNAKTGKPITILENTPISFNMLPFSQTCSLSPDGKQLAAYGTTKSKKNGVVLVDLASGEMTKSYEGVIGNTMSANPIVFSQSGKYLAFVKSNGPEGSLSIFDLSTDSVADIQHVNLDDLSMSGIRRIAFSGDEKVIAAAIGSSIILWDMSGKQIREIQTDSTFSIRGSIDSSRLSTATSDTQTNKLYLRIWDLNPANQPSTSNLPTCTLVAARDTNLRNGPTTTANNVSPVSKDQSVVANGQATGPDGFVWYRLTDGNWVRAETMNVPKECDVLSTVTP